MTPNAKSIKFVCELLLQGRYDSAKDVLKSEYPFHFVKSEKRTYTPKESMAVFLRDGFIDRYSGNHLVFPGTLRLVHKLLPTEFPFHTNWKMSETHIAFWELFPTIDHVLPVARGGKDSFENWVSTSQLRNSAKSNWLLEELGWFLLPEGDICQWDGLLSWFTEFISCYPEHLSDPYISTWHKASLACTRV